MSRGFGKAASTTSATAALLGHARREPLFNRVRNVFGYENGGFPLRRIRTLRHAGLPGCTCLTSPRSSSAATFAALNRLIELAPDLRASHGLSASGTQLTAAASSGLPTGLNKSPGGPTPAVAGVTLDNVNPNARLGEGAARPVAAVYGLQFRYTRRRPATRDGGLWRDVLRGRADARPSMAPPARQEHSRRGDRRGARQGIDSAESRANTGCSNGAAVPPPARQPATTTSARVCGRPG